MSLIKNFPQAHFGKIDDTPVDWRKQETDDGFDDENDDAPASEGVISMIGFDPDKESYEAEGSFDKERFKKGLNKLLGGKG